MGRPLVSPLQRCVHEHHIGIAAVPLLATAQEQVLDAGLWIPTIELSQVIGASENTQDVTFDATARLVFYDTWLVGA